MFIEGNFYCDSHNFNNIFLCSKVATYYVDLYNFVNKSTTRVYSKNFKTFISIPNKENHILCDKKIAFSYYAYSSNSHAFFESTIYKKLIEYCGGKIVNSNYSKADFVFVNTKPLKKTKRVHIDEKELLKLIYGE